MRSVMGLVLASLVLGCGGDVGAEPGTQTHEAAGKPIEAAGEYDWPQWRGPNRDGVSKESNWQSTWGEGGPTIAWRADVGTGVSAVVVANGRAYALGNKSNQDIIHCFNAQTGEALWTFTYECPLDRRQFDGGTATTPTVHDGKVYTVSHQGHVHCVDAKTGKLIWSKHLVNDFGATRPHWGFASSPLIVDDMMIVDAGGQGVATLALNRNTGEQVWASGDHHSGYSSPIVAEVAGRRTVVSFRGGTSGGRSQGGALVGMDPDSGRTLWSFPWSTAYGVNAPTPIVTGSNTLFISTDYGVGAAHVQVNRNGQTQELWRNRNMRNKLNSSVLHRGHVFGPHVGDGGDIACVDLATGNQRWNEQFTDAGAVTLADGKLIYVTQRTGEAVVAEADPAGYKELARATVLTRARAWVAPTLSNGFLYVRNNAGNIVALDLRK